MENNNYDNYKKAACIATVGVTAGLASAYAIPAAVGAAGFAAGGVTLGSMGATMMSWGGGITPGFVSLCQSIGATGVISGSTQVIAGAATAGAAAVTPNSMYKYFENMAPSASTLYDAAAKSGEYVTNATYGGYEAAAKSTEYLKNTVYSGFDALKGKM